MTRTRQRARRVERAVIRAYLTNRRERWVDQLTEVRAAKARPNVTIGASRAVVAEAHIAEIDTMLEWLDTLPEAGN